MHVLRGVKLEQAKGTGDNRLPMTPELMLTLREVWEKKVGTRKTYAMGRIHSVFLRVHELTVPSDKSFDDSSHLTCKDVSVDSTETPKVLKVRLKTSKMDLFRVGVDIFVGRIHSPLTL